MKCGASRIGHGIRSIEDLELVAELAAQKGMVLEICPTSNIQTNAIKEVYKVIEELYRKGVKIVINTDNNTVSNINLVEEYKRLLENTKLTIKDLIKMNIYGRDGAFENLQKEFNEECVDNNIER